RLAYVPGGQPADSGVDADGAGTRRSFADAATLGRRAARRSAVRLPGGKRALSDSGRLVSDAAHARRGGLSAADPAGSLCDYRGGADAFRLSALLRLRAPGLPDADCRRAVACDPAGT